MDSLLQDVQIYLLGYVLLQIIMLLMYLLLNMEERFIWLLSNMVRLNQDRWLLN